MLDHNKIYNPLSNFNKAINKLSANGIRPTKQRMILAKLLFEKGKRHISAEDLFDEVREEDRKISLATIYNTLKQFTSLGLIREIVVDQNKSLYCTNKESHYHLYIEDENKVIDRPENWQNGINAANCALKTNNIIEKVFSNKIYEDN